MAGVLSAVVFFCHTTDFPPDSMSAPASFSFDGSDISSLKASSLASIRDADKKDVSSRLEGHWVAQLASQAQGDDDQAYLIRHQDLDNLYGTYLTTTNDYAYHNTDGVTYWVTLLDQPFSTEGEAQQWCTNQGLTFNDCLPDLLAR